MTTDWPPKSYESIFGGLAPASQSNPFPWLADLPPSPPAIPLSGLAKGYLPLSLPMLGGVGPISPVRQPELKRKVYFAFDFDDLIRVNNVRQAGKFGARTFYDRSIWESRNIRDEKTLKNLMRGAVRHSSAICVLFGTTTWRSRWVKYEIARSIVDQRGLLAININCLNHHVRRAPDPLGYNPLHVMGIYRSPNGSYYLYEKHVIANSLTGDLSWEWRPYDDFTDPVPLPRYIPNLDVGHVTWLSAYISQYDFVQDEGHENIGAWIDAAALRAR